LLAVDSSRQRKRTIFTVSPSLRRLGPRRAPHRGLGERRWPAWFSRIVARLPHVRLVLVTAAFLTLVLTGLLTALLSRTHGEAIAEAERRIQDFTEVLAEHAALVFDDIDRSLDAANKARARMMSDDRLGAAAADDRPHRLLLELKKNSAAASNLSFIDADGERLYNAVLRSPPPLNIADRPYFRAHRDDPSLGILFGAPTVSASTGRYLLPVTRRFDLPDGSFGGITVVLVDPSYLAGFYKSTTHRQRLFVQLALRDGTIIVREPSPRDVTGVSIAEGTLFTRHLPQAPAGTFAAASAIDGVERLVSYKALANLPLVISVSINRADALAGWRQDAIVFVAFYVMLAGIVAAGAWLSVVQIRERAKRQREQAAARDRLRQAQKQQALGTLVGGIAHEINNALLPIMALGEMTEEALPDGSFERDSVAQMRRSADQIDALIKRLLAFSRDERSAGDRLDLAGFLAGLVPELRRALPPGIRLTERIEPDIGAVQAGEEKLKQVLAELATNAAHAIGKRGGRIGISASPAFGKGPPDMSPSAAVDAIDDIGHVRLVVEDDGPGIPPPARERLFEPFFTTKPAGQGVGLGLYTARRAVAEFGGFLDVESAPGAGARFIIYLPQARDAERSGELAQLLGTEER